MDYNPARREANIRYRLAGDDEWQSTCFQSADMGYASPESVAQKVSDWLDQQS